MTRIGRGRTADVYARPDGTVVKLLHPQAPSHWIDREAAALRALEAGGVAAPRVRAIVEEHERRGLVMDFVEGRSMTAAIRTRPWTLVRETRGLARLQHAVARTPAPRLPAYREELRGAVESVGSPLRAVRDAATEALDRLPDGHSLCHGDFHPDNVIVGPRGPVVIDWTTAALGVPAADAARTVVLLSVGELPSGRLLDSALVRVSRRLVLRTFVRERLRLGDVRRRDLEAWLLPVAVARLAEGIATDRPALDRLVRGVLARQRARAGS